MLNKGMFVVLTSEQLHHVLERGLKATGYATDVGTVVDLLMNTNPDGSKYIRVSYWTVPVGSTMQPPGTPPNRGHGQG